jgi:hypothetical protein
MTAAAVVQLNASNLAERQELFFYAQKLSLAEAYGIFEKVYERPFTVTYQSAEECEEQYDSLVQAGNMPIALYMSLCYVLGFEKTMPRKEVTSFEGIQLEDFESTIRRTL